MNRKLVWGLMICLGVCLSIGGCAAPEKLEGKQVLNLLQETVDEIGKMLEPSVVYVEITIGGRQYQMNALALDTSGKFLLPFAIPANRRESVSIERISLWVNQEEYQAELKESDNRLQVSLITITPKEKETLTLTPVKFNDRSEYGI